MDSTYREKTSLWRNMIMWLQWLHKQHLYRYHLMRSLNEITAALRGTEERRKGRNDVYANVVGGIASYCWDGKRKA